MKKLMIFFLLLAALIGAGLVSCSGETAAKTEEDPAEWTVLFYFCGSDLESKYSYATGNLEELSGITYPDNILPLLTMKEGEIPDLEHITKPGKVNVLVETGGASEWHAQAFLPEISAKSLQRWRLICHSVYDPVEDVIPHLELVENLPLASMADPETLTDFIRWGVKTCPAKKYALVLWDHGGGALTGLFIDELFDGDIMYLYELKQALADAGVMFEAVLIDACTMASLETAWNIRDNARWMIASEEVVPGKGTAVGTWLQELYNHPECDGQMLGRNICDATLSKYANGDDPRAQSILTWSVIDLSDLDPVITAIEHFFDALGEVYKNNPSVAMMYIQLFLHAEEYGDGQQHMRDIASILYNPVSIRYIDLSLRNEMIDALADVVEYSIRGTGRSGARGLSFCYPVRCTPEELDIYAKNCPNPRYLAFLDAVTGWDAPDSIYETVERLPDIETIDELAIVVDLDRDADGLPVIKSFNMMINGVYYRLYKLDEATEQTVFLGRSDCEYKRTETGDDKLIWYANEPWSWPSIDGTPCSVDLLLEQYSYDESTRLYNIPIQIGTDNYFLRCGRIDTLTGDTAKRTYEVYGVWNKYDDNSKIINRNVIKLSQLAGQEYRLLWPLTSTGKQGNTRYMVAGASTRLYRSLDVEETTLPPGTYYLEYEVTDTFNRSISLPRITMLWDGSELSFPDLEWSGTIRLDRTKAH